MKNREYFNQKINSPHVYSMMDKTTAAQSSTGSRHLPSVYRPLNSMSGDIERLKSRIDIPEIQIVFTPQAKQDQRIATHLMEKNTKMWTQK